MNFAFIAFALLAIVPPLYTRYEHLHRRDDAVPARLKWSAQVAVGGGAAAHSVCRIVARVRGADPSAPGRSLACSALGVAGGAASSAAMARQWEEEDWAYFRRITGEMGWTRWSEDGAGDGEGQEIEREAGEAGASGVEL